MENREVASKKTAANKAEEAVMYHKSLKPGTAEFDKKKEFIKSEITGKVKRYFGKSLAKAVDLEIYRAAALTIRDEIMEKWVSYQEKVDKKPQKELYYLSFEFLMGRAMGNNLMNIMET